MVAGLNIALAPGGNPLADKVISPAPPLIGIIVIPKLALPPEDGTLAVEGVTVPEVSPWLVETPK
jgi:hypothetical protein